jgi:hypothetical protein
MSEYRPKRITVWVQRFKGRPTLILQWIDPDTGKRKSKSAETYIPAVAEMKRTELEYELKHGLHKEAPWVDLALDRIILPAKIAKGKKDQWVPLDPELREALLALPRHGKKVFRFISRRTKQPLDAGGVSCRVVQLAKKAGVRRTMHTLRESFGCRYAGKVPAQVLQKLMRHRSIRTTMDYYVNVDAAVMEAVLGAKRNSARNSYRVSPAQGQGGDSTTPYPDTATDLT